MTALLYISKHDLVNRALSQWIGQNCFEKKIDIFVL